MARKKEVISPPTAMPFRSPLTCLFFHLFIYSDKHLLSSCQVSGAGDWAANAASPTPTLTGFIIHCDTDGQEGEMIIQADKNLQSGKWSWRRDPCQSCRSPQLLMPGWRPIRWNGGREGECSRGSYRNGQAPLPFLVLLSHYLEAPWEKRDVGSPYPIKER